MPRTSKRTKKSAKVFHSKAANRVAPEAEDQKQKLLERAEEAYSAVQSVFPRCQRRHDVFLEQVRTTSTECVDVFRSCLVMHHSTHQSVYEYLQACGAFDAALQADSQTAKSPEAPIYVEIIPGHCFNESLLGPVTFICCLQRKLSAFDSIFQDVFSDDPGQLRIKEPPQKFRILKDSTGEACFLPNDLGFMAQFWYVFHALQCIVDTIATHVPKSREYLCEIASLEMIEVLEMYCSCYDGDLLLLKSEEGGEHTDLNEFSVASSDLFSASEFLPFFDDASTILAQFFLIVDMCVGKELSSSAVCRSSDEWKSVVSEAKRMFNPSFYKCDVNEFRRRVVKPALGPIQCQNMKTQNTRHRSKEGKPASHVRIQYIFSSLLLENFEKLCSLLMCCKEFVSNCVTTGIWDKKHMREQRLAHSFRMVIGVIYVAVFNRVITLCDLGYCKLSTNSMQSMCGAHREEFYKTQMLLYSFQDANLHTLSTCLQVDSGKYIECMEELREGLAAKCIVPLKDDRENFFKMLCEDKSMTCDDLLSLQTTVEHLKEVIRSQATPFTLQNLTTQEGSSQVRAEPRKSFASSRSSVDAVGEDVDKHHDQMAGKSCTDTSHTTLDKEPEAAAAELSKCRLNDEQSTTSFRERLKKFLTSD